MNKATSVTVRPSPPSGGKAFVSRRHRWGSWLPAPGRWLLGLALFLQASPPASTDTTSYDEYEVKAAMLYNFSQFVDWSFPAGGKDTAPFVVGVVGRDPFGRLLDRALEGKKVKGRVVTVKRVSTDAELRQCQLLFISSSERRRGRECLEKLMGCRVLTVGENDEFLDQGGVINFVLKDRIVRFEVNLRAAQSAGLRVEPNLLKIAIAVRGKYE